MKNTYFFITGRNPALAVAEIEALLGENILKRDLGEGFYIIETSVGLDFSDLQKRLGGTIKIGEIIKKSEIDLEKEISEIILKKISDKKLNFGINEYGRKINALAIKRMLKEKGKSVRLVTSKEKNLSSVITKKEILDKDGVEINIFKTGNRTCIGETRVVQFFEEMSWRDWERPGKDELSGMLPPQLAKTMVNLTGPETSRTLLDPFCGSGTILTEAAIIGFEKLIGSDISQKAIDDTKKNFLWICDKKFITKKIEPQLFNLDVRDLNKKIKKHSVDAIVTEPFLGPPLKKSAKPEEINKNKAELERLYRDAFLVFGDILTKEGIIAIIFPVFVLKNKIFLDLLADIKKMGFKIKNPLKNVDYKFSETTERGSVLYARPGQRVAREIFLFIR